MARESTTLHLGMLDKVNVARLPQSQRLLTEWCLLLASIWLWSVVTWSSMMADQRPPPEPLPYTYSSNLTNR
jgi:hypothetical protein